MTEVDWNQGIKEPGPIKMKADISTKDRLVVCFHHDGKNFTITWDEAVSPEEMTKTVHMAKRFFDNLSSHFPVDNEHSSRS